MRRGAAGRAPYTWLVAVPGAISGICKLWRLLLNHNEKHKGRAREGKKTDELSGFLVQI